MSTASHILLLRAINLGSHNKLAMNDLRSLCTELGWTQVQSYIQSGNLIVDADAAPPELEVALERALAERFGLEVPVIARPVAAWQAYLRDNPFPEASEKEPNRVMLALSKRRPAPDAAERLRERAAEWEHIARVGDAVFAYFREGVGTSKLSPAIFDRFVGSPVTMRNWRTVVKLDELSAARRL